MRADAARNRDRVLEAARSLVAERGAAVAMDDIAAAAGVAVGTLYRHFPTKTDLIAAVIEDSMAQVADDTERALSAVDAGADLTAEFRAVFALVAERHSTDLALKAAARRIGVALPAADLSEGGLQTRRAYGLIVTLLGRATAAGVVRADLTLADLVLLLDGVPEVEAGEDARDRYVDIVWRGVTS